MNKLDDYTDRVVDLAGKVGDAVKEHLPDHAMRWIETGAAIGAVKTGSRVARTFVKRNPAIAAVARLLTEYPASELQEAAHLRRAGLLIAAGKFADAAAEALVFAEKHEDSANAPKALLLAATAQAKQKKVDEAIRTLERLSQKHPATAEAAEALKRLKELRPQ